jgi:hypothetical protein
MFVTFEDERLFMGYIKYDNSTQLRLSFKQINNDIIIRRLYERALKTVKSSSFKTIYMSYPRLAPDNPITITTLALINYRDKGSEKYYVMIECFSDIVLFLMEYGLVCQEDVWTAEEMVLCAFYTDLDDIFKTIPH